MKRTLVAVLMAAVVFAEQAIVIPALPPDLKSMPPLPLEERISPKDGFFYIRFAAAESDLAHSASVLPGLGVGYRRLAGNGAADISISGIGRAENQRGRVCWTAPRATYLHYLQPDEERTMYLGGGLAWGGVDSEDLDFMGIIPSLTAGYEFSHKSSFLGFAELTLSQPAISVMREGAFPGPIAEFSTGIGF